MNNLIDEWNDWLNNQNNIEDKTIDVLQLGKPNHDFFQLYQAFRTSIFLCLIILI